VVASPSKPAKEPTKQSIKQPVEKQKDLWYAKSRFACCEISLEEIDERPLRVVMWKNIDNRSVESSLSQHNHFEEVKVIANSSDIYA